MMQNLPGIRGILQNIADLGQITKFVASYIGSSPSRTVQITYRIMERTA